MAFGKVDDADGNTLGNLHGVTEPDTFHLEGGQQTEFAEASAHIEDLDVFRFVADQKANGLAGFTGQHEIGHTSSSTISNLR
ncbi:hypothetical protein D3C80_1433770 [compost metagenome]